MSEQNNLSRQGETWRRVKKEREAIRAERDALAKENAELRVQLAKVTVERDEAQEQRESWERKFERRKHWQDVAEGWFRQMAEQLKMRPMPKDYGVDTLSVLVPTLLDQQGWREACDRAFASHGAERDALAKENAELRRQLATAVELSNAAVVEADRLQDKLAEVTAERDELVVVLKDLIKKFGDRK